MEGARVPQPRTTPSLLVAALLSTAALAAGAASLERPPSAVAATPPCAPVLLAEPQPLREALGPLSDAEVARRNAASVPAVRAAARDEALWLDRCGRLLAVTPRDRAVSPVRAPRRAPRTEAHDVLALHSRPGSGTTLHLDVTGRVLTGASPWLVLHGRHRLELGAFAEAAGTSATGRSDVRRLWRAVTAALARRDVDVTTEPADRSAPASGRALEVVVSRGGDLTASGCACRSMTYLDVSASEAAGLPALVLAEPGEGVDAVASHVVEAARRMLDPLDPLGGPTPSP
jgi:hypothetical protein